jgi:hypothetical protein
MHSRRRGNEEATAHGSEFVGAKWESYMRWAMVGVVVAAFLFGGSAALEAQSRPRSEPLLPRERMADEYFGANAPWFLNNIPFLEIDDAEIQQIYYYRGKLFRSHIREIGPQQTMTTGSHPDGFELSKMSHSLRPESSEVVESVRNGHRG